MFFLQDVSAVKDFRQVQILLVADDANGLPLIDDLVGLDRLRPVMSTTDSQVLRSTELFQDKEGDPRLGVATLDELSVLWLRPPSHWCDSAKDYVKCVLSGHVAWGEDPLPGTFWLKALFYGGKHKRHFVRDKREVNSIDELLRKPHAVVLHVPSGRLSAAHEWLVAACRARNVNVHVFFDNSPHERRALLTQACSEVEKALTMRFVKERRLDVYTLPDINLRRRFLLDPLWSMMLLLCFFFLAFRYYSTAGKKRGYAIGCEQGCRDAQASIDGGLHPHEDALSVSNDSSRHSGDGAIFDAHLGHTLRSQFYLQNNPVAQRFNQVNVLLVGANAAVVQRMLPSATAPRLISPPSASSLVPPVMHPQPLIYNKIDEGRAVLEQWKVGDTHIIVSKALRDWGDLDAEEMQLMLEGRIEWGAVPRASSWQGVSGKRLSGSWFSMPSHQPALIVIASKGEDPGAVRDLVRRCMDACPNTLIRSLHPTVPLHVQMRSWNHDLQRRLTLQFLEEEERMRVSVFSLVWRWVYTTNYKHAYRAGYYNGFVATSANSLSYPLHHM